MRRGLAIGIHRVEVFVEHVPGQPRREARDEDQMVDRLFLSVDPAFESRRRIALCLHSRFIDIHGKLDADRCCMPQVTEFGLKGHVGLLVIDR